MAIVFIYTAVTILLTHIVTGRTAIPTMAFKGILSSPGAINKIAERPSCSIAQQDECGENAAKYPDCLGCHTCLSMNVTLLPSSPAPLSCDICIANRILQGCLTNRTYFELDIKEIVLGEEDCINIIDRFDNRNKCFFGLAIVYPGSGYRKVMRQFCGHIQATTYRTLTNEPIIQFIQKSNPGNLTLFPGVIQIKEVPYRKPLETANSECSCPAGFIKHRCICYGAFKEKKGFTWIQAEAECRKLGAHLVSILNEEEMLDLKHFIRSVWMKTMYGKDKEISWIYIGLTDRDMQMNLFQWTDSNPPIYTEWYHPAYADHLPELKEAIIKTQFQPSSLSTSRCVVLHVPLDQFWERTFWCKIPCNFKIKDSVFICKRQAETNSQHNYTGGESDRTNDMSTLNGSIELINSTGLATHSTDLPGTTTHFTSLPMNTPYNSRAKLKLQGTTLIDLGTSFKRCEYGWNFFKGRCFKMLSSSKKLYSNVSNTELEFMCIQDNATVMDLTHDNMSPMLQFWRHHDDYGYVLTRNRTSATNSNLSNVYSNDINKENSWTIKNYFLRQHTDILYTIKPWIPDTRNVICERPSITRIVFCQANQWQCEDGTCISAEYHCDGQPDCYDSSDEDNCEDNNVPLFQCVNEERISYSLYCDFIHHCSDGSDEIGCVYPKCPDGYFTCDNGQCIPQSQQCDLSYQCIDKSDELGNCSLECRAGFLCYSGRCIKNSQKHDLYADCPGLSQEDEDISAIDIWRESFSSTTKWGDLRASSEQGPFCSHHNEVRCHYSNVKCFARSNACIYDTDDLGALTSCRDGSHLHNCKDYECPGMYKCSQSYCIPVRKRCNGIWDCPYGEDEIDCQNLTCPGFFRCRGEPFCMDQTDVCDGRVHCKTSRDDEKMCFVTPCPNGCICHGNILNCANGGLVETNSISTNMRAMNLSHNGVNVTTASFLKFYYLGWLDLSHNQIRSIQPETFNETYNLIHLDLGFNKFQIIQSYTFIGLRRLKTVVLHGNQITRMDSDAFTGMSSLIHLDLHSQNLSHINPNTFRGMSSLTNLSLNDNDIHSVALEAFAGLDNLRFLNIKGNKIDTLKSQVFQPLQLTTLWTDDFAFCCAANHLGDGKHAKTCFPPSDEFSTCSDLMANNTLRIAIWVLGFMALLANMFVLIWRCIHMKEGGVANVLVVNLGIADLLMGVYLLIVASADIYYRDVYVVFAKQWTSGALCKIAGLLSFVSSEMSVFMLVLITADRAFAIVFAFRFKKLTMKKALIVLSVSWAVVIIFGSLPLINQGIFYNFYGSNGVCLPFSFSSTDNVYSTLFLAINLLAFFLIALGYFAIYYAIRMSMKRFEDLGQAPDESREIIFLKKMSMVILSDFCCWVPIIVLKFLSMGGLTLSTEVSAWTAVFILPLNSSLNPFLYTISAIREARRTTVSRSKSKGTSHTNKSVKTQLKV